MFDKPMVEALRHNKNSGCSYKTKVWRHLTDQDGYHWITSEWRDGQPSIVANGYAYDPRVKRPGSCLPSVWDDIESNETVVRAELVRVNHEGHEAVAFYDGGSVEHFFPPSAEWRGRTPDHDRTPRDDNGEILGTCETAEHPMDDERRDAEQPPTGDTCHKCGKTYSELDYEEVHGEWKPACFRCND